MPWQPFRRKNKYRHVGEREEETSFDTELLPRSASDGNLVRAPSERFLLTNTDPRKSYGTCSGSSSHWTQFLDHVVTEGETLAGLSLKYNITIQDIKLCNKIWTNEGLWPGRVLRIPISDGVAGGGLDLSGSETMSTDSQQEEGAAGCSQGSSDSSRRLSSISNNDSGLFPDSPVSLPLKFNSPRNKLSQSSLVSKASTSAANNPSVEDLSDFLSKMDSCIAVNKRTADSLLKSSAIECSPESGDLNNTHTRLEDSFEGLDTEQAVSVSVRSDKKTNGTGGSRGMSSGPSVNSLKQTVRGYQGYQNIC